MIRRIPLLILVIALLGASIAYFVNPAFASAVKDSYTFSACDTPISYKVGTIDERFALDRDEVLSAVEESAGKWNDAYNKQLFIYDPENGKVTVNLTYDERQALTNQIGDLHSQLEGEKSAIDPQIAEFEKRIQDFKQRVAALNNRIEYWNSRGGAPEEEFNKLYAEQQALRQEQASLDAMAQKLNRSTNEYNSQVGELNQTIDTFNDTLRTRPEEGLYDGRDKTITIYIMSNRQELLHTLTHELGHAVGLDHLQNKEAVMYYQTNDSINLTQNDIQALEFACRNRTIVDLAAERFVLLGKIVEKTFQRYNVIP